MPSRPPGAAQPQPEPPRLPKRKARPTPAAAPPAETAKDEGVLESLGKAITAPVRDTAAEDKRERELGRGDRSKR